MSALALCYQVSTANIGLWLALAQLAVPLASSAARCAFTMHAIATTIFPGNAINRLI